MIHRRSSAAGSSNAILIAHRVVGNPSSLLRFRLQFRASSCTGYTVVTHGRSHPLPLLDIFF